MGGLLHLVQREGDRAGYTLSSPLLAVPDVKAHPSTASVPITVLLCDGPLRCGFNVAIILFGPYYSVRACLCSVCFFYYVSVFVNVCILF